MDVMTWMLIGCVLALFFLKFFSQLLFGTGTEYPRTDHVVKLSAIWSNQQFWSAARNQDGSRSCCDPSFGALLDLSQSWNSRQNRKKLSKIGGKAYPRISFHSISDGEKANARSTKT